MKKVVALTDAELLNNIRSNTDLNTAIRFIYDEHFAQLSALITYNNGNAADAQDIFQEVVVNFIDVVQQHKFRGESSVKTFLHAMMRNTWLNELKKRGRAGKRDKIFETGRTQYDEAVDKAIENREAKKQLAAVFEKLGDGCKKILTLFYYGNLSMKEILEQTSYENEQVVRNKKHKCLKELTRLVKENNTVTENLKENFI